MTITDTHTHLYYPEFGQPVESLIEKAIKRNVTRFFMPNVDSESMPMMYELQKKFPENCFMMMGLHPCSVKENYKEELAIAERALDQLAASYEVVTMSQHAAAIRERLGAPSIVEPPRIAATQPAQV